MIFTSFEFICFFLILTVLYSLYRGRLFRQWLLLIASFIFYGWWDIRFLSLICLVILNSYFAALLFRLKPAQKRGILIVSLSVTLGILGIFKYYGFFSKNLIAILAGFGIEANFTLINIVLPVGISFYTFQGISYIIDVYRKEIPEETSLLKVALYISFFPQLVAGPIVRASKFIPQLNNAVSPTTKDILAGTKEFIIGFIYKAIFADRIAGYVDPVFANIHNYDNASIWSATFGFYSQIYFDFAGYSIMAIGIARILGYNLDTNFNFPYTALSITDFWRRWHISLSTWLRDYLYIPLGGNRKGRWKQSRNLMITMLLGGLWHGASWNFVLWGGLHGLALMFHKFFFLWNGSRIQNNPHLPAIRRYTRLAVVSIIAFLATQFFVFLCWIPFRLTEFNETIVAFKAMAGFRDDTDLSRLILPWAFFLPVWIDAFFLGKKYLFDRWIPTGGTYWKFAVLAIILSILLLLLPMDVKNFIYFQF